MRDYCTFRKGVFTCGENIVRTENGWRHVASPWHAGAELDAHHEVRAIEDYGVTDREIKY